MGWGWSGARQSLSRRTTALGAAQDLPQHPDLHPTAPSTAPSMEPSSPLQHALLYPRQHLPPRGAQFPRAGGTGMEQTLHGPLAPSGTTAAPVATSPWTPQGKLLSSSSAQPLHPPAAQHQQTPGLCGVGICLGKAGEGCEAALPQPGQLVRQRNRYLTIRFL